MADDSELTIYALRVVPSVADWIQEEHAARAARQGPTLANDWESALLLAFGTLATYPYRCPVADEDNLFAEDTVRVLLFRPRRSGPAWRILFTIHEAQGGDPPTVRVRLVRHAAQAPLSEWPDP